MKLSDSTVYHIGPFFRGKQFSQISPDFDYPQKIKTANCMVGMVIVSDRQSVKFKSAKTFFQQICRI